MTIPSPLKWRKSSYSSETNCVEIAAIPDRPDVVAVRDSKNPDGAMLIVPRTFLDYLPDRRPTA